MRMISSVEDVLSQPQLLRGLENTPLEVLNKLKNTQGWRLERLGQGTHAGKGYILRQYNEAGSRTGRMIQWHPGGGHHGAHPYWKVSSPENRIVRIGPQFESKEDS